MHVRDIIYYDDWSLEWNPNIPECHSASSFSSTLAAGCGTEGGKERRIKCSKAPLDTSRM